jgi:cobalt-precorrin 5A hydrolase/precorrin-3B C17-methyltransferase
MTPAFVALTHQGLITARSAQAALGGEVHVLASAVPAPRQSAPTKEQGFSGESGENHTMFTDTAAHLQALFAAGRPIVGICAAGILIRTLAPILADKRGEPPVLAVADDGTSIVPLLGGHNGGNELARKLAHALNGYAAITTAGDLCFGVALDAPPAGWTVANPENAKGVTAALLAGASARLDGKAPWLEASAIPFSPGGPIRLIATTERATGGSRTLVYHPRRLAIGVGCERGADPSEAIELVEKTLAAAGLAREAVALVTSIDLKADEPAILDAAAHFGVPARFFGAATLDAETPRLKNPSETVFHEVGCHGVAEGAALAACGAGGLLRVDKRKTDRVTCAIAEAADVIDANTIGRGRGRLAVIGIGPGATEWLTPEARHLLLTSDVAIGYSLYLDLIRPLIAHADRFDSQIGLEEERTYQALALAASGRNVALVSSGDPGIYAMAALVFECLAGSLPDGARQIEIVVAPGISAMQATAARIGAPLGHDFCAISLSDLLTPWRTIEARIRAAAMGDFVIAFYNPVSARRRTQLEKAKAILLKHRPAETPVVLARNLGREGETITALPLSALTVEGADMLTLVLVGASTTRQVQAGGRVWTYTPRGYSRKHEADAAE